MALSLFTGFQDPFLSDFERNITRAFDPLLSFPRVGGGALGAPMMGPMMGGALTTGLHPMDIVEHNDRYSLVADAPGMTPEDINVELRDNNLIVTGEKSTQKTTTDENAGIRVHRNERTFNRFTRSFRLPDDTKTEGITAKVENGILTVDIPKEPVAARTEAKRIRVTGGTALAQIGGTTGAGAAPESGTPKS